MSGQFTAEQSSRLQAEVQADLERREWAESDDSVMAEYVTVLLANGSTRERVQSEMADLVGSDFDPAFIDWLFSTLEKMNAPAITPAPAPAITPAPAPAPLTSTETNEKESSAGPDPRGNSRLLNSALAPLASQPEKRKLPESSQEGQNKRPTADVVAGPKVSVGQGAPARGRGMGIRGMAGGRGGMAGHAGASGHGNFHPHPHAQPHQQVPGGFRPRPPGLQQRFGQPNQGQPGAAMFGGIPGQQEMMAQMMMMQANMAQMGQMMTMMAEGRQQQPQQTRQQSGVRPRPPPPVKLPPGTMLGNHSVSSMTPKTAPQGPIPDKPTSTALCKFGVGCSNSRCTYSHPSPVADEQTGMVLSEEACDKGKGCKEAECVKSHVSPAAILGEQAGPSRLLCKFQNCSNASCPFRHEDAAGNPIPPPALGSAQKATTTTNINGGEGASGVGKGLMDGQLNDTPMTVQCRYAEKCTRPDCKFAHPKSRPSFTSGGKKVAHLQTAVKPVSAIAGGGMNKSKKFGASEKETKLNPQAGDFKPAATA